MNQITALVREGKIEEAENELRHQEAQSASSADWHYARGMLCEAKGEMDAALEAYQEACDVDSDHLEATFRLAYLHDLLGDEDEAVSLYRLLVTRVPIHVNALLNLAVVYEDWGEYEEAAQCVDRVLAEYPNHCRAQLFLKDIESSMSMQYDEAQERTREKQDALLDTPVSDFELSVRSRNCLKKMNINTLGDLLKISESELLAYKNFGETSLNEIKAMLSQKGLRLGQLREEGSQQTPLRTVKMGTNPLGSPDVLNKYLSEIEFSGRSRKCLQRLGLVTVGDLVSKSEAELLAAKNFGQTSLNEIKGRLAEHGLTLRKKPE